MKTRMASLKKQVDSPAWLWTAIVLLIWAPGCLQLKPNLNRANVPYVQIIIRPAPQTLSAKSLGVFNFNTDTQLSRLGKNLAQSAKNQLLANQFIRLVGLVNENAKTIDQCIEIGRKQGFDLVLFGTVTNFEYGGITGISRVSMDLRILDVRNKVTLWYVTGNMRADHQNMNQAVLFEKLSQDAPVPRDMCFTLLEEMLATIIRTGREDALRSQHPVDETYAPIPEENTTQSH